MNMNRAAILLLANLLLSTVGFAQQNELQSLKMEFETQAKDRTERVKKYIEKTGEPEYFTDNKSNIYQIYDIDETGKPVYIGTTNEGLARSIGADKLQNGSTLGFNLRGTGIKIGVWDGGTVFGHTDFGTRLIQADAGSFSEHATHVAGTIGSGGLNASAMGMAPESEISSYDWNSDLAEMTSRVTPDETSLLFSNHSYGLLQGWFFNGTSWQWAGNSSISPNEDWRFGFYTTVARNLDQLAFNAPYYSIFWAAGNDRDDRGPNGPPQDGNGGSGYDCLAQEATAKNIFSIGAIRKINNYDGPQSVVMSDFSNWGPTDDGRIKPDLVTPGVSILSTVLNNNYGILGGTSMASPGAAGGLLLMQELYKKLNGKPMRSATLKALAIQTAKEAGANPGPDFSHGWGVLDVEAAAKTVFNRDDKNIFIEEKELNNGQIYEKLLSPKAGTKITITIAWTDPAGTVSASSLDPTDKKLVNDLDLRLVDESNTEQFPWAMQTGEANFGNAAIKADNQLDNVEKLEFENAQPRTYKVRVSHKGTLQGGKQSFSIVIKYESNEEGLQTLYWVGNSGQWSDPAKWSATSGGTGGAGVPNANTKVVFDENSFASGSHQVNFIQNQTVGSVFSFVNKPVNFNLNSNSLTVENDFILTNSSLSSSASGALLLNANFDEQAEISFNNNNLGNIDLKINANGKAIVRGKVSVNSIELSQGEVIFLNAEITTNSMLALPAVTTLTLDGSTFKNIANWQTDVNFQTFTASQTLLEAKEGADINIKNNTFAGTLKFTGSENSLQADEVNNVLVDGDLHILTSGSYNNWTIEEGSHIRVEHNAKLTLAPTAIIRGSATSRTTLQGVGGKAQIVFQPRSKVCFDYLNVENIDITGQSIVNAGANSNLVNSANWKADACQNILFPDYAMSNLCERGLITLEDNSQGQITNREWSSSNENVTIYNANGVKAYASVPEDGEYTITLAISNTVSEESVTIPITVTPNTLANNELILNGRILFSKLPGSTYQWYRDGLPINQANQRSYEFKGQDGVYFVVTTNEDCNLKSSDLIVTSVEDKMQQQIIVWPIPAQDYITISADRVKKVDIKNLNGKTLVNTTEIPGDGRISISHLTSGLYILRIHTPNGTHTTKLIKQ